MELASDIILKIDELFTDTDNNIKVRALLNSLFSIPLNVGANQLARAILMVAGNDVKKMHEVFDSNFHDDPRDFLMYANERVIGLNYGNNIFITNNK